MHAADPAATAVFGCRGTHTLAGLGNDGRVWSWGENGFLQLGDGTSTDSLTPVLVNGITDVVAIAAGDFHSLALTSDGTVWAWGGNNRGQLGNPGLVQSATPVQVAGLTDVVAIAAGSEHSIALKADGTMWSWGRNDFGQLGDGSGSDRHAPVLAKRPRASDFDRRQGQSNIRRRCERRVDWVRNGRSFAGCSCCPRDTGVFRIAGHWHGLGLGQRHERSWPVGHGEHGPTHRPSAARRDQ